MLQLFFLRKSKIFNKNRYSRNRQNARVIFYFALYINIFLLLGIHSLFYGLMFKLTLLWWLFFCFCGSFILGSFLRNYKKN